jgi:hypothetical protein
VSALMWWSQANFVPTVQKVGNPVRKAGAIAPLSPIGLLATQVEFIAFQIWQRAAL